MDRVLVVHAGGDGGVHVERVLLGRLRRAVARAADFAPLVAAKVDVHVVVVQLVRPRELEAHALADIVARRERQRERVARRAVDAGQLSLRRRAGTGESAPADGSAERTQRAAGRRRGARRGTVQREHGDGTSRQSADAARYLSSIHTSSSRIHMTHATASCFAVCLPAADGAGRASAMLDSW